MLLSGICQVDTERCLSDVIHVVMRDVTGQFGEDRCGLV